MPASTVVALMAEGALFIVLCAGEFHEQRVTAACRVCLSVCLSPAVFVHQSNIESNGFRFLKEGERVKCVRGGAVLCIVTLARVLDSQSRRLRVGASAGSRSRSPTGVRQPPR